MYYIHIYIYIYTYAYIHIYIYIVHDSVKVICSMRSHKQICTTDTPFLRLCPRDRPCTAGHGLLPFTYIHLIFRHTHLSDKKLPCRYRRNMDAGPAYNAALPRF